MYLVTGVFSLGPPTGFGSQAYWQEFLNASDSLEETVRKEAGPGWEASSYDKGLWLMVVMDPPWASQAALCK